MKRFLKNLEMCSTQVSSTKSRQTREKTATKENKAKEQKKRTEKDSCFSSGEEKKTAKRQSGPRRDAALPFCDSIFFFFSFRFLCSVVDVDDVVTNRLTLHFSFLFFHCIRKMCFFIVCTITLHFHRHARQKTTVSTLCVQSERQIPLFAIVISCRFECVDKSNFFIRFDHFIFRSNIEMRTNAIAARTDETLHKRTT